MFLTDFFNKLKLFYKKNANLIWLATITLIGAITRLYGILDLPFTDDELGVEARLHYTTFSQLIQEGVLCEGHPAGIQVFIWYWSKMVGYSELALRLPFLILGILCIPLAYKVASKWFNENVGLFVAAYFATSQYMIFHSVVIRPYIPGLFFSLCMLWYWSKLLFDSDYRWKNIFLMGLFGALCAYTHQFSMFFAFLLGLAGLIIVNKKYFWKYLIACLLAVVLYIPHISILIRQIQMGGVGGPDGWLGKPTPEFFIVYPKYIFHFSRYVYITVAFIIGFYAIKNIRLLKLLWKKQLLALLLFLIPLLTAYFYSIYVNPVLQFNILIFSFPFLLLLLFSMIDDKPDILKKGLLLLLMVSMLYSLIYQRKHYELMNRQWFELSVKKAIECKKTYGEQNVSIMLCMEKPFLNYYERKYNESIKNLVYVETPFTNKTFHALVEQQQSDYVLAGNLSDLQLLMTKEKYPYLLYCEKCFTTEILLFSKHPSPQQINYTPLYNFNLSFDSIGDISKKEYFMIDEFPFLKINDSRFTLLIATVEYINEDTNANFHLVIETYFKQQLIEWRPIDTKNISRNVNEKHFLYIPLRYELLFKNSRKMKDVYVKIFLWNPDKTKAVKPLNASVTAYKDNEFIYGLVECLQ
ncbi:MAG TPA: glycosyltransferase family 39 protein [Bacteroidales bacterium]|nr:glycosyltransferase family 39 protein [Bacteroidales bacterium]